MEQEDRIVIPGGEYITIDQAARIAGYNGAGNLRAAALSGRLKSIRINDHARITTEAWLNDYLGSLDTKRGRRRGTPRADQPEGETQ